MSSGNLLSRWTNLKHFCPWISLVENIKILEVECPIALASAAPTRQLGQGVIYQGQPVEKECSQRVLECCCQWAQTVYCSKQPAKPFSDEDELCAIPHLPAWQMYSVGAFSSVLSICCAASFSRGHKHQQISPACLLFFHVLASSIVQSFSCKFMEVLLFLSLMHFSSHCVHQQTS